MKPKLIFFQYKYGGSLPEFLLIHKQEHIRCLSQFFDVIVIDEDCDYRKICDVYQPDIAMFESGVPLRTCRRPRVSGVRNCGDIPKIGFLHADGFCCGRSGFLSDMSELGIETFFGIASTAPEHTPEIAENFFVWPNFVDEELYRDYGQYKTIPVLFTGNKNSVYPWRQTIIRKVAKRYASLICPHAGYAPGASTAQMMLGEAYARTLNASWFVPACGTVAKEFVRKHLEIPACNACLIAERSPVLEAAGFVDMVNCVFADADDVINKIDVLFRDRERLLRIIAAGHELVQTRHTMKCRDQVFQWFRLQRELISGQRIVQSGPFEQLRIVDKSSGIRNDHLVANGYHLSLLREGDERLWNGDFQGAERLYLKCLTFISYIPEPQLKLAICNLLKGKPGVALSWIAKPLQFTLGEYGAASPDPVEWAYYLIALVCDGKEAEAAKQAGQFPSLRYPELDWARAVVFACVGETFEIPRGEVERSNRKTLHRTPAWTFQKWTEHVCIMLNACGRSRQSEKLRLRFWKSQSDVQVSAANRLAEVSKTLDSAPGHAQEKIRRQFKRQTVRDERRNIIRDWLRDLLHRSELRFGYFLPFRLSTARSDELLGKIHQPIQTGDAATIVAIGASRMVSDAFLTGAQQSEKSPTVFCFDSRPPIWKNSYEKVQWRTLSGDTLDGRAAELKSALRQIKVNNNINEGFDVLIIDGSDQTNERLPLDVLLEQAQCARSVFLINLEQHGVHAIYMKLIVSAHFVLIDEDSELWRGYACFERVETDVDYTATPQCLASYDHL